MRRYKKPSIVILVIAFVASRFSSVLFGAEPTNNEPQKIAFVVGVSKYEKDGLGDLKFAELDAAELGSELQRTGFKTTILVGAKATRDAINTELKNFFAAAKRLKKNDVVLLSFSGHGLQLLVSDGDRQIETPFFCPCDALKGDASTLISLNAVMQQIKTESASSQNLMMVDACRDNPAKGAKGIDGSTVTELPNKLSVLFGSSAGTRSYESEKLKHGIFTHYLLEGLRGGAANKNNQVTWLNLASYVMENVRDESPKLLEDASLIQKPNLLGNLVDQPVLAKLDAAKLSSDRIPANVGFGKTTSDDVIKNSIGMELVPLTSAKRSLALFYLGKREVTQGEYEKLMGTNPSFFSKTGDGKAKVVGIDTTLLPVDSVSWYDAVEFCNKLSAKEGLNPYYQIKVTKRDDSKVVNADVKILGGVGYRLPNESEWLEATRQIAPKSVPWSSGNSEPGRTHSVGGLTNPEPGFYDLLGNVAEWCFDEDQSEKGARLIKGGSYIDEKPNAEEQIFNKESSVLNCYGFRVARDADPSEKSNKVK